MLRNEIKKKNLVEILGLEDLPEEVQVEVVDKAVSVIEKRCQNEILESFDEKEKKQFVKVLDGKDAEEVGKFLEGKNIDLMKILEEEVLKFKMEVAEKFQR